MQVGDEQKGDHGGGGVSGDGRPETFQKVKVRLHQPRQGRLAYPAQADAGQGDTQLGGGDGAIQALQRVLQLLGPFPAKAHHFLDLGLPHRDQGELAGHEDAVEDHQGWNAQEPHQVGKPSAVSARYWGGMQGKDLLEIGLSLPAW